MDAVLCSASWSALRGHTPHEDAVDRLRTGRHKEFLRVVIRFKNIRWRRCCPALLYIYYPRESTKSHRAFLMFLLNQCAGDLFFCEDKANRIRINGVLLSSDTVGYSSSARYLRPAHIESVHVVDLLQMSSSPHAPVQGRPHRRKPKDSQTIFSASSLPLGFEKAKDSFWILAINKKFLMLFVDHISWVRVGHICPQVLDEMVIL